MATKLGLYNKALGYLGERKLAALTDEQESRRVLDEAYVGFVNYVLEKGYWKFSLRTSKISYAPSVTSSFGYTRAYEKPADFVKLYKISQDEFLKIPLLDYGEEGGFWTGNLDAIYISYVSNAASMGADLGLWPETLTKYAALYLANEVADRLTPNRDSVKIERRMHMALSDAQAKDALQGPTVFFPVGAWLGSRSGSSTNWRRERGPGGQLIG